MQPPRFLLASSLGALALVAGAEARAGTFTPEGAYLFDPNAAVTLDFEGAVPEGAPEPVADATALHGKKILPLSSYQSVDFEVTLPKAKKSYRVSAWVRGHEAIASLEISYSDRVDDVAALYPTGRVTSD